MQKVRQAHQSNQTIIVQQAEQIQLQRERITELETLQSDLVVEIDVLKDHLDELRTKLATSGQSTAGNTESASNRPAPASTPSEVVDSTGKIILGQYEWVWFDLMDQNIPLSVDPGARQSALFVKETQPFERDGKNWVRFSLAWESEKGVPEDTFFEAPLTRMVKSRNANVAPRPVINLRVQIGTIVEDVSFTLVRKNNSGHPGVLGRNLVRDIAVIDVARQYVQPKHMNGR